MHPNEKDSERLFTYGTLRQEQVQLATFGRRLNGTADALVGYRLRIIRIDDHDFIVSSGTANHRNLEFTGNAEDVVEGTVFTITQAELEQVDSYEPAGYARQLVQLSSGLNAWVYLAQVPVKEDLS
jgi:gamma-glutamylcyclotransferase (GGCT)/AIG2-like uncharacterized protein YtfP